MENLDSELAFKSKSKSGFNNTSTADMGEIDIYKTLFTHYVDVIFFSDLNGRVIEVNDAAVSIVGYKREEFIGKHINSFLMMNENNSSSTFSKLRLGQSTASINSVKHKDGRMMLTDTHFIPIKRYKGMAGFIAICKDVTKDKKQELELRKLLESLNHTQFLGNTGSWDYDVIEDEAYWSRHMYRIFGIDEDSDFVPTFSNFLSFAHSDDRQRFIKMFENSLLNGRSFTIEYRIIRFDGEEGFLSQEADVILDENEKSVRLIGTIHDITEQKRAEEKMNFLSYYDYLTQLPNRKMFDLILQNMITNYKDRNRQFSLLYFQADRIKQINETLGHAVGDELLVEISRRITSIVTNTEDVARMDGGKFVIILSDIDSEGPIEIAEKLLHSLKEPFHVRDYELYTTANIGICSFPDHGNTVHTLMKNSLSALNYAKKQGRNLYQLFGKTMQRESSKLFFIEKDLGKALKSQEFVVHYQPRVCTYTGKILSAEALLRWNHPKLGAISPREFIPLAEENGLIFEISDWVIRVVCNQLKEWQEKKISIPPVSINLSAQEFYRKDIISKIEKVIEETEVRPNLLEFEITESSYLNNMDVVLKIITKLKDMGIKIALDDFGTGFSSLTHLKDLNIDTLKIDRSFIQNITEKKQEHVITSSVIQLAHGLDIKVVAEGVEIMEQLEVLRQKGCDQIQGYIFSKPVPPFEFKKLMEKGSIKPSR